ncbi:MAG: bifunctional YncE family protein/alkaline phosphatase family protein [Acidobacteriaceae bacterium]|nr:bifunctional YncE family protein/alkaline phosphatase family protein [Acidobacteriaceae bacterium]
MKSFFAALAGLCGLLHAPAAPAQTAATRMQTAREQVGPVPGGFLLNSGWTIRPAGEQVPVDTLPMSSATSNDGRFLLVLNGGYNPPSISVIDVAKKREIGRTKLADAWLGLTFSPDGKLVYVGGGSTAKVFELSFNAETGALSPSRELVAVPDLAKKGDSFIGDVALSPDGRTLYATNLYEDGIAVINVQTGKLVDRWKTGRRPYRILLTPGGNQLLISCWGDAAIYQHEAASGVLSGKTRVGPHASDMVWVNKPAPAEENQSTYVARVFVAAANTNNVYSFGVTQSHELTLLEGINVSMTPMHPLGMTPSAVAVDKDGKRLYVVCSDANAIAVINIESAHSRVEGFIPTGWYPTAARVLNDGQLVMLNGKGLGSKANPRGPNPTVRPAPEHEGTPAQDVQYVAHIQTGTVAFLPGPGEDQIGDFTRTVLENSPYRDEMLYGPITNEQTAFFAKSEDHGSPIQHVIYVIRENRTYDQVFGDMAKGNGDKSLNLFGEKITPNAHQLASEFILYDNFYENADVSADGHNWADAAIAPDYTMKLWPNEYGHRSKLYDFEGGEPANTPPTGYLWDNALQAGLTIRDYGEWVTNVPLKDVQNGRQVKEVMDDALKPYVDMNYRGFDLEYSDVDRAKEFMREWNDFDAKGQAPQLIVVRMGNDHTMGARAGALTPFSYAADNDYGVGMLVDAVSHSRLWASTAIFIIEDDAQNGPDHVDSHRAPVLVVSPYTHRGTVDSMMYNQASVLRTMELIIGLRPMTHFDAGARPMFGGFSRQADTHPYTVIPPKVSLKDRNPQNGPGAVASAKMDFSDADRADDDDLNDVLWRMIKHSDPPAPMRSAFGR